MEKKALKFDLETYSAPQINVISTNLKAPMMVALSTGETFNSQETYDENNDWSWS
ncbi:MAG: hypothetical protein K5984_04740 [Bacteroidales bacterium]|nr:hypothetical protein [Bacteroidales bacterium]